MLQSVGGARLVFDPDLPDLAGAGWLILDLGGDEEIRLRRSDEIEYRRIHLASGRTPQHVGAVGRSALWVYRDQLFRDDHGLRPEEVRAAIAGELPASERRAVPRTTTYSGGLGPSR